MSGRGLAASVGESVHSFLGDRGDDSISSYVSDESIAEIGYVELASAVDHDPGGGLKLGGGSHPINATGNTASRNC